VTLREAIASTAQGYLYRLISECRGNLALAAKRAGYSRTMFYKVLRRYGIITGSMDRPPQKLGRPVGS
jgi:transcriptional regulator of acetoin/glycerol metabolism